MSEKNDVFVGNLTFNTTEADLIKHFSFVGPVKNVRILRDKETDRPKGFAFVEYYDTNTALAAIRYFNQSEFNQRKIKVSFPSHSNLRTIAKELGDVIDDENENENEFDKELTNEKLVERIPLSEAWDILDALKMYLKEDKNGQNTRSLIQFYPQLIPVVYQLYNRLGIPISSQTNSDQSVPMNVSEEDNQHSSD